MPKPKVTFQFEGKRYSLNPSFVDTSSCIVQLPDGTLLQLGSWNKKSPPEPTSVIRVSSITATEIK